MKVLYHPGREEIELSSVLYALSDPIRLYIVSLLRKHGENPCNFFEVPIAKSTLSHHIRTLREAAWCTHAPKGHNAWFQSGRKIWKAVFLGCWIPYLKRTKLQSQPNGQACKIKQQPEFSIRTSSGCCLVYRHVKYLCTQCRKEL
jgi:predicted transcriptional regulator